MRVDIRAAGEAGVELATEPSGRRGAGVGEPAAPDAGRADAMNAADAALMALAQEALRDFLEAACGAEVLLFACQPAVMEPGGQMSEEVRDAVERAVSEIRDAFGESPCGPQ